MRDNVTYAYTPESFNLPRYCITCKHWDSSHVIAGFATCDKLVFASKHWRLIPREGKAEGSPTSIVRTMHDFECKYWEDR